MELACLLSAHVMRGKANLRSFLHPDDVNVVRAIMGGAEKRKGSIMEEEV